MMRTRRGYSFVELLVVLTFIGLIARIAVPHYKDMKQRGLAGKVMGDVHAIRIAAMTYYTEKNTWPPESGPGVVPTELVPHLPKTFDFTQPDYAYDYENWSLSGGLPGNPQQSSMIAVSVTSTDVRLVQQLVRMAGKGLVPFVSSNKVTFFLSGTSGN